MAFDDDGIGDHVGRGFEGEPEADTFRPPPHPDDRLWRHPSEFRTLPARSWTASSAGPTAKALRSRQSGRPWALIVVATAGGAIMAAAILTTLGVRERVVVRPVTEKVAVGTSAVSTPLTGTGAADGETTADPLDTVEQAMVQVDGADEPGSGWILRDDGIVLTSAAVVENQQDQTVPVTLADGTRVLGEVLGADAVTDVAVLRLPSYDYPTAVISEEGAVRKGAEVVVVAGQTDGGADMTSGVVTSSNWTLQRLDRPTLNGLLQIGTEPKSTAEALGLTEAVSPGGPVVDERGAVVGMTTSSAVGWAYAVPIDVVTKIVGDVLSTGMAQHGWLGIQGRDTEVAAAGVVVVEVARDGPVEAHLASDDVIVALDGLPVPNMASLKASLLLHSPGDRVTITYYRPETTSRETVEIALAERPDLQP